VHVETSQQMREDDGCILISREVNKAGRVDGQSTYASLRAHAHSNTTPGEQLWQHSAYRTRMHRHLCVPCPEHVQPKSGAVRTVLLDSQCGRQKQIG
jgi:hypothetical protein